MSLWSRIANVFRSDRLSREIDEELASHIAEAIEHGRDPVEARRAFGSSLRQREESRDVHLLSWFDSLRADAIFGWRQLMKRKVTSAAAVLSLALAIGACTAAFCLIDALLLRPLPIAHAERLYSVAFQGVGMDGKVFTYDSCSYPMFSRMRAAVREQGESVAVSYAERVDLTFASDSEMEKAYRQYVSGWIFPAFGLHPALGRLFTADDDAVPGANPVAVLSHDYWMRRFAGDPQVVGRTFHMGDGIYQIVGVADRVFTGTETGTVTDVFLPMAMKYPKTLASSENFWLRTLIILKPGVAAEPVRQRLRAVFHTIQEERAKNLTNPTKTRLEQLLNDPLVLEPAAAGRSNLQLENRRSLMALGILVILVLLIACANVANLMTACAASRAREMALRVAIGAGRGRLVQLVLVESAWLASLSAGLGALFAWWSAPFIIGLIDSPENPARLILPADWRVFAFGLALAAAVTFLFGLMPALHASSVKPARAMKGGDDPHSRRRIMHALIAAQVAFCFIVQLVSGLFIASFDRLSHVPTGFFADRILNLETVTPSPQPPAYWYQVIAHLRELPGVESASLSAWPLMSGESAIGDISINGGPPAQTFSDIFSVSPGWLETLRIPLIDGRDFRASDSNPAVAIVNEAFSKEYFQGEDPVGKSFERRNLDGSRARILIVGLVRNARLRDNPRLPFCPTAFVPFQSADSTGAFLPAGRGDFVVRTSSANPLAMASMLRREIPRARPEFRVSNIRTQTELVRATTVRERLLSILALFFGCVALLLAGVGLYGVLDYSVLQRRREIGIRMAIGARAGHIARGVTAEVFSMIAAGALVGMGTGMAAVRYIETLLYQVKPADPAMLAVPSLTIVAAALVAAIPAVVRAVRIDPVSMLRTE
jgi:putative ABC transport system permease protein